MWTRAVKGGHVVKALKSWMMNFGRPLVIVCDNARYFVQGELRTYMDKERIQLAPASIYTPEGNAKVENFNGQLQYTLARITLARNAREGHTDTATAAKRWYPVLTDALMVRNQHISRVTGLSPYNYVFRQDPPQIDQLTSDIIEELTERREKDLELVSYLREHANRHRIEQRQREDSEDLPPPKEYQEGDLVWYYRKEQDQGFSREQKILPRWDGPYQIAKALSGGAYRLQDVEGQEMFEGATVNHRLLTPVRRQMEWYEPTGIAMTTLLNEFEQSLVWIDWIARDGIAGSESHWLGIEWIGI